MSIRSFLKRTALYDAVLALRCRIREIRFPISGSERKYGYIFVHIPKNAGTSIKSALGHRASRRLHLPWYVYYNANPVFYRKSYKFTVVRNPWDRTLSAYRYLLRGGNKTSDATLSEMLQDYEDFEDFVINGLGAGRFRNHLLFLPQSTFILNGEGEICVDDVIRFENLNEGFESVAQNLRLQRWSLPQLNKSGNAQPSYASEYKSDQSIRIVGELYKQDIQIFHYKF